MSFSNVVITGRLVDDPDKDGYRHIECPSIDIFKDKDDTVLIPIRYWNQAGKNTLNAYQKGSSIIIKGRFSKGEKYPIYVLVEKIETIIIQ